MVTIEYSVTPAKAEGAFRGTETDRLERRNGRWAVTAWDRVK